MSTELETKQEETKIDNTEETIIPDNDQKPPETTPDKARELELENARLKGMLEAKNAPIAPPVQSVESEQDKYLKTKQTVLSDSTAMDSTDFEEKYKMSKAEAKLHFTTYEFEQERMTNKENMALLRAENQIVKKYGDKYAKYQDKIDAAIKDLAPAVRQDPQRLANYIEITLRSHLLDEKDETPAPKLKKESDPMNRRIIESGFEKPGVTREENTQTQKKSDEIDAELQPLAAAFGLTSEKERQKFSGVGIDVAYGRDKWMTKNGVQTIKS